MTRALMVVVALLLACAAPAAASAKGDVDLVVTAEFDKPSYLSTEDATVSVTVTNIATEQATGVMLTTGGSLDVPAKALGVLDPEGPGAVLAPGEELRLFVTGRPVDPVDGIRQELTVTSAEADFDPTNNTVTARAGASGELCDVVVVVYGDENDDGQYGDGEGMIGLVVTLNGADGQVKARTDATGTARFTGLRCGGYSSRVEVGAGWLVVGTVDFKVRPGEQAEQVIRAVRNDSTTLTATIALDRDTYAVGDTVRERVTVTNWGRKDVAGIFAFCGYYDTGPDNELISLGWGELDPAGGGPGLLVRAGETRSFEFSDVVSWRMWEYGFVVLRCRFSLSGSQKGSWAEARAAVPGGRGVLGAALVHDGRPLSGVKVLLVDQRTGAAVARAVSDVAGAFQFPATAAGEYELRLVGPWRFSATNLLVQVFAGDPLTIGPLEVLPGPNQPDPDASPSTVEPTVAAPAPQASARPANLADTGASAGELAALAMLLLLAGGALLICARRKAA